MRCRKESQRYRQAYSVEPEFTPVVRADVHDNPVHDSRTSITPHPAQGARSTAGCRGADFAVR